MRSGSKWKKVVGVFGWVVVVALAAYAFLVWVGVSRMQSAAQHRDLPMLIFKRFFRSSPRFTPHVEEPPLRVGSPGPILSEEKSSSKADTPSRLEDDKAYIQCWLDLYDLTLQDVSSPVTGIPRGTREMYVEIMEDGVFLEGVTPGRYRLIVTLVIHRREYRRDVLNAVRVGGRQPSVKDLNRTWNWCWPFERLWFYMKGGVFLSNWDDIRGPEKLRDFDPSEFVGIEVKRWEEAVPARWALLDPFPVAQFHEFDEKGWYRSVGFYRRGSVPERVVVHLYSSEGDLLMSVRTQAIKVDEAEKKPQRP